MADLKELLAPRQFRWPKPGDQLMKPAGNQGVGAELASDPFVRETFLWRGYVLAASLLIDRAQTDDIDRHDLVYPILFCYRHGLEIAMKWTLNQYGRYAAIEEYEKNHRLTELWRSCKRVMEEVGEGAHDEATEVVESIVAEFDKLDPGSFAFRYPLTKKGKLIELPDFAIDLDNVRDVMTAVDNFFSGLDGLLHANATSGYYDRV